MTVTPERYRQFAVASLVALFLVIVAGAAVRLTNSGLGCDDWPNCNQTTFVDVSSKHAAIEQVNRLFNGIVTVAVLLVAVLSHRVQPRPRGGVGLAWTLVALVAANAVLGGIDGLVFTAGIGENSAEIRRRICEASAWLGIDLDAEANARSGPRISRTGSRVSAWVVPTNEELIIARHTGVLLGLTEAVI